MSLGVDPDGQSRKLASASASQRLSMEMLADRFAACEADPSMRSFSAVLRITREQLRARDNLGFYPAATAIAFVLSIGLFAVVPLLPKEAQEMVMKLTLGGPLITLILAYATWTSRDMRRAYVQQERELRAMAAKSLEIILAHDFPMKPLLREQVDTLRIIAKHHPEAGRVRELGVRALGH